MIQYASHLETPGCIYMPGDAIATPKQFKPEGFFFLIAFGPLVGTGNLYGIPSDLLQHLQSEGTADTNFWTDTADGNELSSSKKSSGYFTMSRMICEFRLSQVEQAYIFWDYSPTMVVNRFKGL